MMALFLAGAFFFPAWQGHVLAASPEAALSPAAPAAQQEIGQTGQAAKEKTLQKAAFAAGPGIAVADTESGKIPEALGNGFAMNWAPVVDGRIVPTDPVTADSFAEAGRDVPLLIGSNRTEWTNFQDILDMVHTQSDNRQNWSAAEVNARLQQRYGDQAEQVVSAFLKAYPEKTRADALYIDTMIRLPIRKIMEHKAAQGGAPVYAYLFAWDSPVMGGVYQSYHTAEIPFVFHNIDKMEARIGTGKDAYRLSDRMSDAWIYFARYGTPASKGLPKWDSYTNTKKDGATMILDDTPRLAYHHDRELMKLLAPDYEE